eukprot:SAG31_NODE_25727_length_455_cov_1.303371_1_plen_30_part_01
MPGDQPKGIGGCSCNVAAVHSLLNGPGGAK